MSAATARSQLVSFPPEDEDVLPGREAARGASVDLGLNHPAAQGLNADSGLASDADDYAVTKRPVSS